MNFKFFDYIQNEEKEREKRKGRELKKERWATHGLIIFE